MPDPRLPRRLTVETTVPTGRRAHLAVFKNADTQEPVLFAHLDRVMGPRTSDEEHAAAVALCRKLAEFYNCAQLLLKSASPAGNQGAPR